MCFFLLFFFNSENCAVAEKLVRCLILYTSSHLVKLFLLLLQVGDNLPQVVLVHQQVVQLLLDAGLALFHFLKSGTFLLKALVAGLHLFLEPLLCFLGRLQETRVLLHLLFHFNELWKKKKKLSGYLADFDIQVSQLISEVSLLPGPAPFEAASPHFSWPPPPLLVVLLGCSAPLPVAAVSCCVTVSVGSPLEEVPVVSRYH